MKNSMLLFLLKRSVYITKNKLQVLSIAQIDERCCNVAVTLPRTDKNQMCAEIFNIINMLVHSCILFIAFTQLITFKLIYY